MSRTIKDMPPHIRGCYEQGRPVPSDWRPRWGRGSWRSPVHDMPDRSDRQAYDLWWNDDPYPLFYSDPVVGRIAREENRIYRAKSKQAIREGRYDDIPKPVRNARWLAY